MKKKLFTTILTVAVAATTLFSNTLTTNAAEQKVNPLVEQLNALTGNYIGYDMTYADKVKVLNACFASSAAMQNYTLVVEPSYDYSNTYWNGQVPETKPSTRVTKTFLYDHGNFMYDYNDSVTGAHMNSFYTPSSLHMFIEHGAYPKVDKASFLDCYTANNLDANYARKLHQCAYSVEELAATGQYTEIEGQPYLVCTFNPETVERAGCRLSKGESFDGANSTVTYRISLSNYGAFSFIADLHIFAGPDDPLVPNGHYRYHFADHYTNVNTTAIPVVPASYVNVF